MSFVATQAAWNIVNRVSRSWRRICSSSWLMRSLPLVPSDVNAFSILQAGDSAIDVCTKLLPFVEAGNTDALYLQGVIAIYFFDDLQVGLSLLERAVEVGDFRSQLETAVILQRQKASWLCEEGQRRLGKLQEAGYYAALSEQDGYAVFSKDSRASTRSELASTYLLAPLMLQKPSPPYGGVFRCRNEHCFRQSYNLKRFRARLWVRHKPFHTSWEARRGRLLACGVVPQYSDNNGVWAPQNVAPLMLCRGCCEVDYCSRSCQLLDWNRHKRTCGQPLEMVN